MAGNPGPGEEPALRVISIPWGMDELSMAVDAITLIHDGFDVIEFTSEGTVLIRWAAERDENGKITAIKSE